MSKKSKVVFFFLWILTAISATAPLAQSVRPSVNSPMIAFTCSEHTSRTTFRMAGICTIRADGTDFRRLTDSHANGKAVIDKQPVWSPDGKRIAFLSNRDRDDNDFDIYLVNPDGSDIRRITHTPRSSSVHITTTPARWSTDSKRLAYIEGTPGKPANLWVVEADGSDQRKLDVGNIPNSVFDWVSPDAIAFVSVRDGKWVLSSVDLNGSAIRPVMSYGRWISSATWSPDRKRIAFSAGHSGSILEDNLYVSEAEGANVIQLTHERGQKTRERRVGAQRLAWSPDGKQVAFTVTTPLAMNSADPVDIYVINIDGTGQHLITTNAHAFSYPAWSPDGKYIAFHSYGQKGPRAGIYVVNSDGSSERFLVEGVDQVWRP